MPLGCKDIGIKNQSLWQRLNSFMTKISGVNVKNEQK